VFAKTGGGGSSAMICSRTRLVVRLEYDPLAKIAFKLAFILAFS
jgi:hypothetical protein